MDESEYEVSDIRSPSVSHILSDRTPLVPDSNLLSRHWRRVLAAGSTLLALVVLFSVWLPLHSQPNRGAAAESLPFFPPTLTPILTPSPLPITSALGAPPTQCPSAQPLTTTTVTVLGVTGGPVRLTGHAPVWIATLSSLRKVMKVSRQTTPARWPSIPFIWASGPNAYPAVTVQVHNLQSNTVAWWGVVANRRPQWPTLMMGPNEGISPQSYVADGSWLLFITRAGCYKMDVSWPGGSWSFIFAAGAASA